MEYSKDNINEKLVAAAYEAMEYAYVPYSDFRVGASLITKEGRIYSGCNIENASYGATVCAERAAIFKAVSEGSRCIERIAIVSSSHKKTPPCGICRQVMSEFMPKDGLIILADKNGIETYTLKELLPESFHFKRTE